MNFHCHGNWTGYILCSYHNNCGCEYITIRKAHASCLYKAVAIHFYSDSDTNADVMIAGYTVACTHVYTCFRILQLYN